MEKDGRLTAQFYRFEQNYKKVEQIGLSSKVLGKDERMIQRQACDEAASFDSEIQ